MSTINFKVPEIFYNIKILADKNLIFQYFEDEEYNGRTITLNGKKLIYMASCSYLGLETHQKLKEGAINAVIKYGTQTPSSRAILSCPIYKKIEELLPQMFPGYSVIFQTVTLAHCSILPLLIDNNDVIIIDAYAHNSIRMASKLCIANGTQTFVSRHNDMNFLEYLIKRINKEKKYKNIWYCCDGIYSIHGNKCDIENLYKLLDKYDNFYAYIDDAHGTGWCGKNGSGYVFGTYGTHQKAIIIHSFAKSMAALGGCVIVQDEKIANIIKYTAQTMIFSGPIQPPTLGALYESIKIHLSEELNTLQNKLHTYINYFRKKSSDHGIELATKDDTPIQLLKIGDLSKTYLLQKYLFENGFFTTTTTYPAIAKGDEGIRITLTNHLQKEDIDKFIFLLTEFLKSKKYRNA